MLGEYLQRVHKVYEPIEFFCRILSKLSNDVFYDLSKCLALSIFQHFSPWLLSIVQQSSFLRQILSEDYLLYSMSSWSF